MSHTNEDRLLGMQFGSYRLQRLIASGGMARIYEAKDVVLDRIVAVKVLNLEGDAETTMATRFKREAKAVANLDHEQIVQVYAYGEAAGCVYIAMKLIDGRDLSQEMSRSRRSGQKIDPARALHILEQAAQAIDYAHANGIIHRDIKPSNILIDKRDRAYLTDFGLLLQEGGESTKTRGTAFGTPRYIAPEQALASQNAVPQSDIYSLAVILYEILTGEAPFTGETPMEIALGHIGDPPRPPRSLNNKIPHGVERELLRALEKDPPRRHATAIDFIRSVKAAYAREMPSAGITETSDSAPSITTWDDKPTTATTVSLPDEPQARKRRIPVWLPIVLLLLLVCGGVVLFMNRAQPPAVIAVPEGANEIELIYDADSLVIRNPSTQDLNFFSVQFIRGVDGDRDDFTGDRIQGGDTIPAGQCYLLYEDGTDESVPAACAARSGYEVLLGQDRFFWRREPVDAAMFEVWYNRVPIAQCPTISAGASPQTCRFTWQTPEPTATPAP
jgi:serine/threonine protein kinase